MRLRCPHCHHAIELVDPDFGETECPSCGSQFNLAADPDTVTRGRENEQIAQFELTEHLGDGAFGSVWKARDTKLDRTVAVKIPRSSTTSLTDREAFLREARAAAQLEHPNIVTVHEVGLDNDRVYIVSQYIEGVDLKAWDLKGVHFHPRKRRKSWQRSARPCTVPMSRA